MSLDTIERREPPDAGAILHPLLLLCGYSVWEHRNRKPRRHGFCLSQPHVHGELVSVSLLLSSYTSFGI